MRNRSLRALSSVLLASALAGAGASAATLPEHGPLRVLVVSDEVNPHNLAPADITQRGEISAALNAGDSGLTLAAPVTEVFSQCVDDALAALASAEPPDVVVYFAHMAALGCDGESQEAALIAAFEAQLARGGGIIVLHHGSYDWPGKDDMLGLLGVSASSIAWDTSVGQRVFNVAPGHFITSNGMNYAGTAEFITATRIPNGTFEYFDNVPDERYPDTSLLEEAGEDRTLLFATNSGPARVLGYALERTGWAGRVVFYQPAEYQPNALDDRDGPNFQILANSIVYSARQDTPAAAGAGGAGGTGGNDTGGGNAGTTAAGAFNGGTGGEATSGGQAGTTANAGSGGSTSGSSNAGGSPDRGGSGGSGTGGTAPAGGGGRSGSPSTAGTGGAAFAGSNTAGSSSTPTPSSDDGGCGCRVVPTKNALNSARDALAPLLAWGTLFVARRRKSRYFTPGQKPHA